MHRPTLGMIAVVLLVAGAALHYWSPQGHGYPQFVAAFVRVGAVLAALWLALPDVRQPQSRMLLIAAAVMILVLAVRPRLFLPALGILLAVAILRPRIASAARRMR